MKKLFFFAVLFTLSLGSFSQESTISKDKPKSTRSEYNKSVLQIGFVDKNVAVFSAGEKYNWVFSNVESEADKLILKKLQETLAPYKMSINNEVHTANSLTFSVSFSSTLTYAELVEAAGKIKVRVVAKDSNKTEPVVSKGKPEPEVAK